MITEASRSLVVHSSYLQSLVKVKYRILNSLDNIDRRMIRVKCPIVWCGVVWCGVVWCGVVWCGVVWCGVVWCGVVWCGVMVSNDAHGDGSAGSIAFMDAF